MTTSPIAPTSVPRCADRPLLVIDDDPVATALLSCDLGGVGFAVRTAPTFSRALEMIEAERPGAIVTEQVLPDGCVLPRFQELRERARHAAVFFVTRHASVAAAVLAIRSGAAGYMAKPASAKELTAELVLGPDPDCQPCRDTSKPVMTLEQVEWEHINRVLVNCGGNVSQAARQLRMHRRTLQRKLAYGVPGNQFAGMRQDVAPL